MTNNLKFRRSFGGAGNRIVITERIIDGTWDNRFAAVSFDGGILHEVYDFSRESGHCRIADCVANGDVPYVIADAIRA